MDGPSMQQTRISEIAQNDFVNVKEDEIFFCISLKFKPPQLLNDNPLHYWKGLYKYFFAV